VALSRNGDEPHWRDYDAVVGAQPLKHPVVSVAVGATATVLDAAGVAYRAAERLPVVGSLMRRGVSELSQRGDRFVAESVDPIKALVSTIAVQMVELMLEEMDLTAFVRDKMDLNALAAELDLDALINEIDLIALADKVIDGVDLPAIIRNSTTSVTAVTTGLVSGVRAEAERADKYVAGIVNEMLGGETDRSS
jgi:hypothetical protein